MDRVPLVSVVMPVYNGERYIREAIESVLTQTFEDFEFLIVDNGSTDRSVNISRAYRDTRIRVLAEPQRGLVPPLNSGLCEARGLYVARMDADDISAPERFTRQVAYMHAHPNTILVGSWAPIIDAEGKRTGRCHTPPLEGKRLYAALCMNNEIVHGSVMLRRDAVLSIGGYRSSFKYAEDYDLWFRLAEVGPLANIAEPLYFWRINQDSTMHSARDEEKEACAARARRNALERYLSRRQPILRNAQDVGRPCSFVEAPQHSWFNALDLNDWAQSYLEQPRLCTGDYLLLRAMIAQPRDATVWQSVQRRYASMATAQVLLRASYSILHRSYRLLQRRKG